MLKKITPIIMIISIAIILTACIHKSPNNEALIGHIFIKCPITADYEATSIALRKMQLIRSNIIANIVEFEQSAYESSECPTSRNGGRLGWIKDGQEGFPKAFVDVALSLNVNEISQIIHTDYGYHILKCYEVK